MRRADWTARLRDVVREYRCAPFAYGRNDCALFAARCVDAMTGTNWTERLHGSRRAAARILKYEGGLMCAVTNRLGEPVRGNAARRGDVCLVGHRTLAVCLGSSVLSIAHDGLYTLPLARVLLHWRVD